MHSVGLIIISKLSGELVRLDGEVFEVKHQGGARHTVIGSVNIIDAVCKITKIKNIYSFGYNELKGTYDITFEINDKPNLIIIKKM